MFRSALSKIPTAARPIGSQVLSVPAAARYYHENVISHYERPRNVRLAFFRTHATVLSDNGFRLVLFPRVTSTSAQAW